MKKTLPIALTVFAVLLFATIAKAGPGWDYAWEAETSETGYTIYFLYDVETNDFNGNLTIGDHVYWIDGELVATLEGYDGGICEGTFGTPGGGTGTWKGVFVFGGFCASDFGPVDGYWCWDENDCEEFSGDAITP